MFFFFWFFSCFLCGGFVVRELLGVFSSSQRTTTRTTRMERKGSQALRVTLLLLLTTLTTTQQPPITSLLETDSQDITREVYLQKHPERKARARPTAVNRRRELKEREGEALLQLRERQVGVGRPSPPSSRPSSRPSSPSLPLAERIVGHHAALVSAFGCCLKV